MNYCRDCTHFRRNETNAEASECRRKTLFSPVTGACLQIFCNIERTDFGTCKPEGIHFKKTTPVIEEWDKTREWERWVDRGDYDYDVFSRKLRAGT